MHIDHLGLHDFRSYATLDLDLEPGATVFSGRNGQGKTNLVEAVDYLSRLASHRVAGDAALVRHGAERAVVRAAVVRAERRALLEVEVSPGRSNRARINRSVLPRARDLLGVLRTVLFSPEDLALVKGDPADRRGFLDDLLVLRSPRLAGVRADYERVLKQRNSLLKSARTGGGSPRRWTRPGAPSGVPEAAVPTTLAVWDAHLARTGAEVVTARVALVEELRPLVAKAYAAVAEGASADAALAYRGSVDGGKYDEAASSRTDVESALLAEMERRRGEELDRGVSLVGPHRDELLLTLGSVPMRGYASHGEAWSFAVALRLASYELLRSAGGDDPVLILDDVFAELDSARRDRLGELVAGAEQVLVTAAVPADVPAALRGRRLVVHEGRVRPDADR